MGLEPIVGRDQELALCEARLDEAAAGRGGLVFVTGEAGVGKSALVDVLVARAAARGFEVLTGRAWESSEAPAWFPLRPGLRALGLGAALLSDADAFGLWEDVLEALARPAARPPLLWLVEDVHAADLQTLDLLTFLTRPLRALRVLVVVTARTADPRASDTTRERLTRLARDATRVSLAPLLPAAVAELVTRLAGAGATKPVVAAIIERAGGNALFAAELARNLRSSRDAEGHLPDTIVQVVLERLSALPAATRATLTQASLLGRELNAATVARMTDRLPAAVIDDLLPAVRSGLLEELAPGRFRFSHALVRDTIHDAMPVTERRAGHAAAERVLAELGDGPDVLVERAGHALEAHGVIDDATLTALVGRAALASAQQGAHDRALALWSRLLASRAAPPESAALLRAAALAARAGAYGEARRFAESARAIGRARGDVALVGASALAMGQNLRPAIVDAGLVQALGEALAGLEKHPDADRALVCRVRARLAAASQPAADPQVPIAMARRAIAEARALGDPALLTEVLFVASSALTSMADVTETHALALELAALLRAHPDAPRALAVGVRVAMGHVELGEHAAYDAEVDRLLDAARALGHPAHTWRVLLLGSMRALARGQLDESDRLVTELDELAHLTDDPALVLARQAHEGVRALASREPARMRQAFTSMARMLATPEFARARAEVLTDAALALGDYDEIAKQYRHLIAFGVEHLDVSEVAVAAEAAALVGSDGERTQLLARVAPLATRGRVTGHVSFGYQGPMARVVGLLEASLGRTAEAKAHLGAAFAHGKTFGLAPWVARLETELGAVGAPVAGATATATATATAAATAAATATATTTATAAATAPLVLAREGDVWCCGFAGRETRVKDSRGVQLLARLCAAPGLRIHALALASDEDTAAAESDAGDALDATALRQYRARLATLDGELADAESDADLARSRRLRDEREVLLGELRRAVGLGGRARKIGSATERARVNVTRRLREAITRLAELDAELGRHLDAAVRTGTYCDYRP